MTEYGITDSGFVPKRLDTIMDEVHDDLTEGFGFDTRKDTASFLSVLVTSFSNQIERLWEEAQEVYYSLSPLTAYGVNLDNNSGQFSGVLRKGARPSKYPIHCTGDDGTILPPGTEVKTSTMPEILLNTTEEATITRAECNAIQVRVASAEAGTYYVIIDDVTYTATVTGTPSEADILNSIKDAILDATVALSVDTQDDVYVLNISKTDIEKEMSIVLSDNLTTASVTSIIDFYTEETGKIVIADGVIDVISTAVTGFNSCVNHSTPTYGRDIETDEEYRQSITISSMSRSSTMIGSIVSELRNNVEGVTSASGYENDSDTTNPDGVPPHSIEIVVEGGDNRDVAEAILLRKAGGIGTYGSESVDIDTSYGDTITIKFNRPTNVYAWMKIELTASGTLPSNFVDIVRESILNDAGNLAAGEDLYIQKLIDGIYAAIEAVTFVDITVATSSSASEEPDPSDYHAQNVIATNRQVIKLDASRIEVTT